MDKNWIHLPHRYCPACIEGIRKFELARQHTDSLNRCKCHRGIFEVEEDLLDNEMDRYYTHWEYHGEPKFARVGGDEGCGSGDKERFDVMQEMLQDIRSGASVDIHSAATVQSVYTTNSDSEAHVIHAQMDKLQEQSPATTSSGCTTWPPDDEMTSHVLGTQRGYVPGLRHNEVALPSSSSHRNMCSQLEDAT